MSWLVVVILAVVWAFFLIPAWRRRRQPEAAAAAGTVVVEGTSVQAGLVVVGVAVPFLAVVAIADRNVIPGLMAAGCAALLPRLWQQRDAGPVAVADIEGIRLRYGRLRWEEVVGLVRVGSAHYVLAAPGAPPVDAGWFANASLRLDRGVTGLDVWGGLPAEVAAFALERGVPAVSPETRGAWWVARVVFWFLS